MFTKTRSLFFLIPIIIISLVFTACGGAQPSNTSNGNETGEPPAAASTNKNITIVIPEDPPSFNPMVADTGYDALVMELVLLGLTDIDPNGNIFPELATELPTIENGGVTLDEE